MRFRAESGSGHSIVMDASPESGGRNAGVRPMEAMLSAVGGCTGMDVISILRKKRQNVTGYEVRVSGERSEEHPRVFTRIDVEHVVRGVGVDPAAVKRAVELSTDKYCSAIGMMKAVAKIDVSFRVEADKSPARPLGSFVRAQDRLRSGQGLSRQERSGNADNPSATRSD